MSETFGLLFARPSFIEGAARILDLGNTLNEYNRSLTPDQADRLAINSDIHALREDLARVRKLLSEELASQGE